MIDTLPIHKIAIIIPAYKAEYLYLTLESLANQTDRNFAIYIGDDNSPVDLLSIIHSFKNILDITYKRFDNNLGGNNLVSHWNRCLSLMNGEEFFIMFSDDDMMEMDCISSLKEALLRYQEDVFHFDLQIIDKDNNYIEKVKPFPPLLSSIDFFELLCTAKIDARIPEFVFRTDHFKTEGGFEYFDQAIRTDNATVIKCAFSKGIRTVPGPKVLWRDSGINISSAVGPKSKERYENFLSTSVYFFNWMDHICRKNDEVFPWSITRRFDYLFSAGYNFRPIIGTNNMLKILKQFEHYPKGFFGNFLWLKLVILKAGGKIKYLLKK